MSAYHNKTKSMSFFYQKFIKNQLTEVKEYCFLQKNIDNKGRFKRSLIDLLKYIM